MCHTWGPQKPPATHFHACRTAHDIRVCSATPLCAAKCPATLNKPCPGRVFIKPLPPGAPPPETTPTWSPTSWLPAAPQHERESIGRRLLGQAGLADTFRRLYPDTAAYTYFTRRFNCREQNKVIQ